MAGKTDTGQKKLAISDIHKMKADKTKITNTTAYDHVMATIVDEAGIDMIGVGGSLGMIILGYDTIVPVTQGDMEHHLRPVARAVKRGIVIAPLPFGSYLESNEQAIRNAVRMLKNGADSVQTQGGGLTIQRTKAITDANIPCIGHAGLTPQYVAKLGGLRAVGKTSKEAKQVYDDCLELEDAGAWAIELECVPAVLGRMISQRLSVPIIGVGSGTDCDGQYLNLYDALGLLKTFKPRFARQYAHFFTQGVDAMQQFKKDVREGNYPAKEVSIEMEEKEWMALQESVQH